ncbi:protein obstructor-E-like [Rhopalosiphum maidis]|uniref:protein obstructor-E-like n=1 Tax=Rhopalosiphum maidis TaxID=43146 RepID=UPI000EFFAFCE|nr:protein obstructor-E-like [Rhopalosiphum maidis]
MFRVLVVVAVIAATSVIYAGGVTRRTVRRQRQYLDNGGYDRDAATSSNVCPERNGRYPLGNQCDKYLQCENGVPTEKLCPDGLFFNSKSSIFSYPCQYPPEVDCEGRTQLQPPQSTSDCPRQFGYFRLGDETKCGKFLNCVNGIGYKFDCPEGLAFNELTFRCDWPDQVDTCDAEAFLGFRCPPEENPLEGHKLHPNSMDCQKFYLCVSGRPRLYNCGTGLGFNELIGACDIRENVTSCYSRTPDNFVRLG